MTRTYRRDGPRRPSPREWIPTLRAAWVGKRFVANECQHVSRGLEACGRAGWRGSRGGSHLPGHIRNFLMMRSHFLRITPLSSGAVLHECCGEKRTMGRVPGQTCGEGVEIGRRSRPEGGDFHRVGPHDAPSPRSRWSTRRRPRRPRRRVAPLVSPTTAWSRSSRASNARRGAVESEVRGPKATTTQSDDSNDFFSSAVDASAPDRVPRRWRQRWTRGSRPRDERWARPPLASLGWRCDDA